MAVIAAVHGGYHPSKSRTISQIKPITPPPIFISANPNDVNFNQLKNLYSLCNYSPHRFPKLDSDGKVEPVDIYKLRKALIHSYVVVSVFTRADFVPDLDASPLSGTGGDWIGNLVPVTPANGELIGFGRAASDSGLTAAIYDVMGSGSCVDAGCFVHRAALALTECLKVIPSLRRRGIGRKIVQRIIRILANRDIYDIAALCSDQEKLFFGACGFGDDALASTTMMYTRPASTNSEGEQMVKYAGRKLLLVPSLRGNVEISSCKLHVT